MTNAEKWTIVISCMTLFVTVVGWIYTARKQKELTDAQIVANQNRDSWQLIYPPRIRELEELKTWLKTGARLYERKTREPLPDDEENWEAKNDKNINEWASGNVVFISLARRLDPSTDVDSLIEAIYRFFIPVAYYLEMPLRDMKQEIREDAGRAISGLPELLRLVDAQIDKLARQKP